MGYFVARLSRPYDYRVLIEAFVYTRRQDFPHEDFSKYYAGLVRALEGLFGIRLSEDGLSFDQRVLWSLFENTARSLLRITTPWDSYLEATLIHSKLAAAGEAGRAVDRASTTIHEAAEVSQTAHRDMLYALFVAIFGECDRVVTSAELAQAGFDDSREPNSSDYYEDI